MSSLKQPFPPIQMPLVDSNGSPTPAWIQFFQNLQARTGGAAGPSAPFTGASDPTTAAAVAALTATVSGYSAAIAAANAATADAEIIGFLSDDATSAQLDQAALLAQTLAD